MGGGEGEGEGRGEGEGEVECTTTGGLNTFPVSIWHKKHSVVNSIDSANSHTVGQCWCFQYYHSGGNLIYRLCIKYDISEEFPPE